MDKKSSISKIKEKIFEYLKFPWQGLKNEIQNFYIASVYFSFIRFYRQGYHATMMKVLHRSSK